MYFLFGITAAFLYGLAFLLGSDYYTVNIWFYCIVGPLFFLVLIAMLWAETAYGVAAHLKNMNAVSNVMLIAALLAIAVLTAKVYGEAMPVFHSLATGNKAQLFQRCVDYLNLTRGGISYVDINVYYFCLLGLFIFFIITFLDITGLHQFRWRWLAAFHEPHTWRYWLNTIILGCCVPCCYYALYVLKRYVMIR